MNAHPASSVEDFHAALRDFVFPVREKVCPGKPFAIAPHIGAALVKQLAQPGLAERVGSYLRDYDLHLYTVNAFPLKDFHARRVKELVYQPSWAQGSRAQLTCKIADVLVRMSPSSKLLTISTLGGGYRPAGNSRKTLQKMAINYLKVVAHLARIEYDSGYRILLNAEPEPDTTFECAEDVISFWQQYLQPGIDDLAGELQCSKRKAEKLLRRHWTVNLDACHSAVLFRSPLEDLNMLDAEGIQVGKFHVTSAPALKNPGRSEEGLAELLAHVEPRYLHQTALQLKDGSIERLEDLPLLRRRDLSDVREVRTHFHVPLSRARHGKLATTRGDALALLEEGLRRQHPRKGPHLAIETYTWPVLTKGLRKKERQQKLIDGIAAELRWAKKASYLEFAE
ncbi:MAG: hypothetical protein CBC13_06235 [Planctomycetia bacterium TMED53]|nr:MAG: hypothetical protein CBC13_06235 [Planctomycetia bacterium TMED53]